MLKEFISCTVREILFINVMKSRDVRWAGFVARVGGIRKAYKILIGKFQVKSLRPKWGDNIKMNPVEVGYEGVDDSLVADMVQ